MKKQTHASTKVIVLLFFKTGTVSYFQSVSEFSEYLLETRVLTSADFNTYPRQIFSMIFAVKKSLDCRFLIEIVLAVICKNLCQ